MAKTNYPEACHLPTLGPRLDWRRAIRATLEGHPDQVNLDYHPNLNLPAPSRYAATTPNLLGWFDKHNDGRDYSGRVRPNNFLLAFQVAPATIQECPDLVARIVGPNSGLPKPINLPKPVAPYDTDPTRAADKCFDRDTGIPVPVRVLKTYKDALAQYHLRPEHKFLNGRHTDRGITRRRHVRAVAIRHIGKESNRWQEKFYLGSEDGTDIDYGLAPDNSQTLNDELRAQIIKIGQRRVARESGVSRRTIERLMRGGKIRTGVMAKIFCALSIH